MISFISPRAIHAQESVDNVVLFINQVRGTECCQEGNLENIYTQINAYENNNLSANFNLRYDVLKNDEYIKLFKSLNHNQFEIGSFLEITPDLANDSGVSYSANESNWAQAHNAYTLGYDFSDRTKIIDTYMSRFYSVFGYYPKTTTAWVMDTQSINYLKDKYGVTSHQITREQWGTDSYTLSGGPVHYPYFGSKNWSFIPASDNHLNKMLILRQTGSDPLYNYGDDTNAFTTQPNDYAIDGKDINYFKDLTNNFFNQNNNYNFLLLGLENSMPENIQSDYVEQINYIGSLDNINSLTASKFKSNYSEKIFNSELVSLSGEDYVNNTNTKVLWINTKFYRARILIEDNQIKLSDLRYYNQDLEDPYNSYVAQNYAFWVVPYIFDGSRFYDEIKFNPQTFESIIKHKFLPELDKRLMEQKTSNKDIKSQSDGIIFNLEDNDVEIEYLDNNIQIKFKDSNNEEKSFAFYQDYFVTPNISDNNIKLNNTDFINKNNSAILFNDSQKEYYGLDLICNDICIYKFRELLDINFKDLRDKYYYLLFPEVVSRKIDLDNSVLYAHNQYTILEKNPVRMVLIPRDEHGLATLPLSNAVIKSNPEISKTISHPPEGNGTTFLDIFADNYGEYIIDFSIDDYHGQEKIYFAPDCKVKKFYCLTHPRQAVWYLKSMFFTKLRNF